VVRKLETDLLEAGRSKPLVRKVLVSLGSILGEAVELGQTPRNAVRELRRNRRKGQDRRAEKRQKGKLKVGVHIPTPDEIKAILAHAKPRWRPLLVTAAFTGLRSSELRGLRWTDVDLKANEIHVRQRADCYREIGKPKTHASERTVPLPPSVTSILREWKLQSDFKKPEDFVFTTKEGRSLYHGHIIDYGHQPAQVAAGLVVQATDKQGKPLVDKNDKPKLRAKYTGLHALRHFYASWCLNRKKDGGLELPPKNVQERLGHTSIIMTVDLYGHLFARGDDSEELDQAAQLLLA
jgi:integrase